jgi:endo-1,4-beta-xylanase
MKTNVYSGSSLKKHSTFPVGSAVIVGDYKDNIKTDGIRNNLNFREFIFNEFSSITVENEMKMDALQPEENQWFWDDAFFISDLCKQHNTRLHGHTLAWHNAVPKWVEPYVNDKDKLQQIFETHIRTVATHFRGKVKSWDVINEVINDESGSYRETIWYQSMGSACIENAFRIAHEADPEALLFYNDYDLEFDEVKLQAVLKMIDELLAKGVPIHGMGLQMHLELEYPPLEKIEHACCEFVKRGLLIHFSELDIRLNPLKVEIKYPVFTEELEIAQKVKYEEVVKLYKRCVPLSQRYGITFWGISDKYTWLRTYFKRLDWPHLFDDYNHPKLAYYGVVEALAE